MPRNVRELLNSLSTRDFYISKDVDEKYLNPLVEEIWKGYRVKKGAIVHYSVVIAYTIWKRGDISFDQENALTITSERTRDVDLGRVTEFLGDQELTLYVSILVLMYGPRRVGEDFTTCFKAIKQLAEKGLELLYLAVSSESIVEESITYMEDMELLFKKLSELKIV